MKQVNLTKGFNQILQRAYAKAPHLESWPMYYKYRHAEIKKAILKSGVNRAEKILDLGCGNSFSSSLLSVLGREVFCLDVPKEDSKISSIGLEKTRIMQKMMGTNGKIVGAVGEKLPFRDNEFDLVFVMHVLEYAKDREKVIKEISRVIKPGGKLILTVATSTERIYAIPHHYLHVLKWIFKRLKSKPVGTTATEYTRMYRNIFLPAPHGYYKGFIEEVLAHRKRRWLKIVSKYFKAERTFAGMLYPIYFANELLGFRTGYKLFTIFDKVSLAIEKVIGEQVLIPFSNSMCIIAKKQ